jgi:outer membrane protein OmpA-like peptidoglycan-associated protein
MRTILLVILCSLSTAAQNPFQIKVTNQLTKMPIDASLVWSEDESVRKVSVGVYAINLSPGQSGMLQITKPGYFDAEVKLGYEEEKTKGIREIELIPTVPQLRITILDATTNETLTSAIDLFTMDESSIVFSDMVETAPYTIDLEYNKVHVLQVRCRGYFSYKDTIDFSGVFEGRERERKITLVPLKEGNKISLSNIHFKPNESDLTDFAKLMLVELTHVLAIEKSLVVEIGAHTDDVGSTEYNLALSQKRALAVKKQLMEKGAQDRQLLTKGFGESSPLVANSSEENRAQNRRVEFKIIRMD